MLSVKSTKDPVNKSDDKKISIGQDSKELSLVKGDKIVVKDDKKINLSQDGGKMPVGIEQKTNDKFHLHQHTNNINIEVVRPDTSQIIVEHQIITDTGLCKFIFYDKQKRLIGSFSSVQLIKYITSIFDNSFMQHTDMGNSVPLIETYVCTINQKSYNFELKNHMQSPFMGNIEMILKMYSSINLFEKKHLIDEINMCKIDTKSKTKILNIIRQVSYDILNHLLKIINNISDVIKNDKTKTALKNKLLSYSVVITNKITSYVKEEMDYQISKYSDMQNDMMRIGTIRIKMDKKVNELSEIIRKQPSQASQAFQTDNISDTSVENYYSENASNKYSNTPSINI